MKKTLNYTAPPYRFAAFLLLVIPHILIYGGVQIVSSFGEEIMDFLDIGEKQLSFLSALGTISKATAAFVAGFFAAKFGGKKTVQIGLLVMAVSGMMYLFAPKAFGYICAIRVVQGIGGGISNTCLLAMVCSWFPKRERGVAQGAISGMAGASISIATIYAQYCANMGVVWYKAIGYLLAVAGTILFFVLQWLYKDVEPAYGVHNVDELPGCSKDKGELKLDDIVVDNRPCNWKNLACRKEFWLIELSAFISGCVTLSNGFIIPLFLTSCGFSPAERTSIMSTGAISSLLMAIASGFVSRYCYKARRCETVIIGYGVSGALFMLLLIVGAKMSVASARVLFFFAFGMMYFGTGPFWTMTSEISTPAFSSRCVGASLMLSGFGGFIMTNILGAVVENHGMRPAMLTFCLCYFAVISLIAYVRHIHKY